MNKDKAQPRKGILKQGSFGSMISQPKGKKDRNRPKANNLGERMKRFYLDKERKESKEH
jgi:Ca2+-binding EF-hand superfamily protein